MVGPDAGIDHGCGQVSEFHYVRTLGQEGGVDACEGPAIGLDLETVLKDGLPPWKVALEMIAALCEVLDIADQDGEIHGEVDPQFVFIDETGAVSLEGFGVERRKTRAPEGTPRDTRTDLYGLGRTALRIVTATSLPERMPDGQSAHDDAVIDLALGIDLSDLDEAMQGDVQWFIAKLLSHDREDRPPAVDAWRTFVAFAAAMPGPDMAEWCAKALDGGGERRNETRRVPGSAPPVATPDDEDLSGPAMQKGFLTGRPVNFEDGAAGAAKGGATAFWTKEDMKRALDAQKQEVTEEGPPAGIGGGSATNFWSKEQLAQMERGDAQAPRPQRAEGVAERRKVTAAQTSMSRRSAPAESEFATELHPSAELEPAPPSRPAPAAPPPPPPRAPAAPPPKPPPRDASGPVARAAPTPPPGVVTAEPGASRSAPPPAPPSPPASPPPENRAAPARATPAPAQPRPPEPPAEEEQRGGWFVVLFGGSVIALGGFVALLILLVILLLVLFMSDCGGGRGADGTVVVPPPPPAVPAPLPPPAPITTPDPAPVDPVPPTPARPDPRPGRPDPRPPTPPKPQPPTPPKPQPPTPPKPQPQPQPQPPTPPKPQPQPPTPPKPGGGGMDVKIQLRSSGRGSVRNCTESTTQFDGMRNFVVAGYKLPAVCLVEIDGARGVFTVNASGDITCDKQGTAVVCDKAAVP